MLGKRSSQKPLFEVGNVFPLEIHHSSFHGQLARAGRLLFRDEDFSELYAGNIGRPSVPPSQLALLLILQNQAGVGDQEAVERSGFDLRWCAVLGREAGRQMCAKSTLQTFRAQLVLHEKGRLILERSITQAKKAGLFTKKAVRLAIDTKPIFGRGAVEDTYNLLATAIRGIARVLAEQEGVEPAEWLDAHLLSRFNAPSIKGTVSIDWSDKEARKEFLGQLVEDATRMLELGKAAGESAGKATNLLAELLMQDVRALPHKGDKPQAEVVDGTVKGRIPSATDPEQRHGRKSSSQRFNGHKASVAVDTKSQIITAVEVLPGNAPDAQGTLELVESSERSVGLLVADSTADCAYGGGELRQQFEDAGRILYARVPRPAQRELLGKHEFNIDLDNDTVTCPQGHTVSDPVTHRDGSRVFHFGALCENCPMREKCTSGKKGRTIQIHPQERLLNKAREYQRTEEGIAKFRSRLVVENTLARVGNLGIGQARYIGRRKTLFQLVMAATIANLQRVWNWQAEQPGVPFRDAEIAGNAAMDATKCPNRPVFHALTANIPVIWQNSLTIGRQAAIFAA